MSRKFIAWLCIIFIGLIVLTFPLINFVSTSSPLSTKTMGNAKGCALACKLWADDNGGKLPDKLRDVVPNYLSEENYRKMMFRDFSGPNDGARTFFMGFKISDSNDGFDKRPAREWEFFRTATGTVSLGAILIASPYPSLQPSHAGSNIRGKWVRIVVRIEKDGLSGAIINEEEFQREIKAQLRADVGNVVP